MIARYRTLARRIQLEVEELERTQAVIQRHWQTAIRTATDQDAYLNSVALNLHSSRTSCDGVMRAEATPGVMQPAGRRKSRRS